MAGKRGRPKGSKNKVTKAKKVKVEDMDSTSIDESEDKVVVNKDEDAVE